MCILRCVSAFETPSLPAWSSASLKTKRTVSANGFFRWEEGRKKRARRKKGKGSLPRSPLLRRCCLRFSLLRGVFKVGRNEWPILWRRRRSYRASNFCEGPKITGRRVPDVVEIRNFENRLPSTSAALPVVPLWLPPSLPPSLPPTGGDRSSAFVTREGCTWHARAFVSS
jgi:hypothetical protein